MFRFLLCVFALVVPWIVANPSVAQQVPIGSVTESVHQPTVHSIRFEAFVRGDRPSAKTVSDYADDLRRRVPGLDVQVKDVLKNRDDLARLYELSKKAGRPQPVVPSFYSCNRMYFGFTSAAQSGPAVENLFTANVYTRSTCQKCQAAKRFFAQLRTRWPAVRFRIYEVTQDAHARATWQSLCRSSGSVPGLPTIDFAGSIIIGYQGDSITGAQLERLIQKVSGTSEGDTVDAQAAGTSDLSLGLGALPSFSLIGVMYQPLQDQEVTEELALPEELASPDEPALPSELSLPDEFSLPDEAAKDGIGEGLSKPVEVAESSVSESNQTIDVPFFGSLDVGVLGLPLFTFVVGLVDGFNPCAMWVLVFLLSVLVNIKDRRKIIGIAGTFVVVSGLAYFAFMAAWLNLFILIGIVRPVQITLGLLAIIIGVVNVKDFFAFKKGITFSIPESQKPGLYRRVRDIVNAKYLTVALAGAVALAVIVNMIELLCTAGLPALYTQILMLHELPTWKNYLYLGLYIAAYMLDDLILVIIVVATLSHRRLQEREGRWLKLLSGLVILALGLVMLFHPAWLQLQH